jgi:hypothetical protein
LQQSILLTTTKETIWPIVAVTTKIHVTMAVKAGAAIKAGAAVKAMLVAQSTCSSSSNTVNSLPVAEPPNLQKHPLIPPPGPLLRGVPLLKNADFRLSDPDFRGWKFHSPTAIHCKKTPADANHTLQDITCVTSVTNIIAEMFGRKNM